MKKYFFFSLVALLPSCSPRTNVIKVPSLSVDGRTECYEPQIAPSVVDGGEAFVLKATAFRMSGDYSRNVAVTLDPNGNLAYFPAVTDISESSRPVEIGDGWWLNRQGLGPQSVFTKWTFEEYSALKSTPTAAEIKAAIIPGAEVTDYRKLPISASSAQTQPAESLLQYLK